MYFFVLAAGLQGCIVQRGGSIENSVVAGSVCDPAADGSLDVAQTRQGMVGRMVDQHCGVVLFPEWEVLLRVEVQREVQETDGLQVRSDGDPQTEGVEVLG